jgi:AraC family transcriptional regulator
MVPQTTTSMELEAFLANRSKRSGMGDGWRPLVVRSRIEPDRREHLFLPATPDPWIVSVISGRRRIEVKRNGRWHGSLSGPGQVAITAAGSTTEVRWQSLDLAPIETLHVCLDIGFLRKLSSELGRDAFPEMRNALAESDPVLASLAALLRQELYRGTSNWTGLFAAGAAQMLGARLLERYAVWPAGDSTTGTGLSRGQIRHVIDYIDAHLTARVSIDDLAAAAGVSPYHFARMFKRSKGITPHQFVASAKYDLAKRLLLEKRWSIKRIAHHLGFASAAHFSTAFKSRVGCSPVDYRSYFR